MVYTFLVYISYVVVNHKVIQIKIQIQIIFWFPYLIIIFSQKIIQIKKYFNSRILIKNIINMFSYNKILFNLALFYWSYIIKGF